MNNQPDFRTNLCFEALWDTKQWFEPAFVQLDSEGCILSISEESKTQEPTEKIRGFVIPGHNNAHSHAFQYALAGPAEHPLVQKALPRAGWGLCRTPWWPFC